MVTWFAFGIWCENSTYVAAFLDEEQYNENFQRLYAILKPDVETYILGYVRAKDVEEALDNIYNDNWLSYTQSV